MASAGERVVTRLSDGWTAEGAGVSVPHTWNALDGADGLNGAKIRRDNSHGADSVSAPSYLRKSVTYTHALPPKPAKGRRLFVRCGGAAVNAIVCVNGEVAGRHSGPVTAFCYEITEFLHDGSDNRLEIVVDNYFDDNVPPTHADYTVFGGLYRPVWLIETDATCIDPTVDGGPGVRIDATVDGTVKVWVDVNRAKKKGANGEISFEVIAPDGKIVTSSKAASGAGVGKSRVESALKVDEPKLWSPETPNLYTMRVTVKDGNAADSIEERFGFRSVEFREDGFYLNGHLRKLRGVNFHQEREGKGWALSDDDIREDVRIIKEMGADAVRTAHYPHSTLAYDETDRLGLVVWCELPATDIVKTNAEYRENLLTCAREMLAQQRNHPSIVFWSLFNELSMAEGIVCPVITEAKDLIRRLDPSRPLVGATNHEGMMRLNALPDELAVNIYPGWYGGNSDEHDKRIHGYLRQNGRKIIGVSEYGGGASINHHENPVKRPKPGGRFHPEEYQTRHHATAYRQLSAMPEVWGTFVWAMYDFAADTRTEGERDGINDKGLVTRDRKTCKDSYFFYKANWNPDPILHLCGKRMKETDSAEVDITAFSNLDTVKLRVNGKEVGTLKPDAFKTVEWKKVPLEPGENVVELVGLKENSCGLWRDSCKWIRLNAKH